MLDWTICEPALGSGAFLNEAINQVAARVPAPPRRRARQVDLRPGAVPPELQKVKAYIALHNCYGVDLNRTAVELAEVSLWLNVMHAGPAGALVRPAPAPRQLADRRPAGGVRGARS